MPKKKDSIRKRAASRWLTQPLSTYLLLFGVILVLSKSVFAQRSPSA
jgi:hypothetical protein